MMLSSQSEIDAAIARGETNIRVDCSCVVSGSIQVTACGNVTVTAFDNVTVRAYDNVTVMAYDNATVMAYGNATVMAFENTTVVAHDNITVVAYDNVTVRARGGKTILMGFAVAFALGGEIECKSKTSHVQRPVAPTTVAEWCESYGIQPTESVILYKCVDENFGTRNGITYKPGETTIAPDWDGGKVECGGGLHFCPHPALAKMFKPEGTRFVRCRVRLDEISMHPNPWHPTKIKAPRCEVIDECDIHGHSKEQANDTEVNV